MSVAEAEPSRPAESANNGANGGASTATPQIRVVYRDGQGNIHTDWSADRIREAIDDENGLMWVDILDLENHANSSTEALLRDVFHFHALAIEDALKETHVPKVDDWDDYLYIVFQAIDFDVKTDKIQLHEIDIFLGRNYVVTYHNEPIAFLEQDRKNIEREHANRLRKGAGHLLYTFLDLAVAGYLPAIEHLDEAIDRAQDEVFRRPTPRTLQAIFRVKRAALGLHRILAPEREVMNRLARDSYDVINEDHRIYFRDVYDHLVRIHDLTESLRDLISSALDTYLSAISNRTNDVMKTLTIVTVMFLPMSFLTGFFGMNYFGETLSFQSHLPKAALFTRSCLLMAAEASRFNGTGPGARAGSGRGRGSGDARKTDGTTTESNAATEFFHKDSSMTTRWRLQPFDRAKVESLSREAGVSALVAQILLNRGIGDPAAARSFVTAQMKSLHDPELLPGAVAAADRLVQAVRQSRKIVIYGDYDVDGVCGTSILWACLRLAGAKDVGYYIPHRVEEGYGVNAEALKRIASELKAEVVVTVDCGISAVAEAKLARELGLEFIITDHHTPGPILPEADVIVHPRVGESAYPFPDLCGAAVAFKLAWQICKAFGDGKKASPHLRDFLVRSIGLVALATVADVVPLTGENRTLVRHGLAGIEADPSEGLRALMHVSGAIGKRRLTSGTVGFGLAPRINAAGRMERAMRAVEMLTTDDATLARVIAAELNECNTRRQEVEQSILAEARAMVDDAGGISGKGALVLGREGWHAGVIGIVASRLVEIYHRPTIIVALNEGHGQGSARSVPGFNLYEAIAACSEGLIGFGGHAAAAGLKLTTEHLPVFAERFDHHCRETMTAEQRERVLHIDAETPLGALTTRQVDEIEALEPYGIGNPKPILVASGVRVLNEPRVVGPRQNHAQITFTQSDATIKAVAWNMAERCKTLRPGTVCSVVFHPSVNEWNGRRDVQLELKDFQIDGEEGAAHAQ